MSQQLQQPLAPEAPWYRKPWAFAMYGVLGAALVFGMAGGSDAAPDPDAAASPEGALEEGAVSADLPAADPPVEDAEAADEPAADVEPQAPADEKDSLSATSGVAAAQDDLGDLREDLGDLSRDLSKGNLGWAAWNLTEVTVNVADLSTFDAPVSIAGQWSPLMAELDAAHDRLIQGYEDDSISAMESAMGQMSGIVDRMEDVLGAW